MNKLLLTSRLDWIIPAGLLAVVLLIYSPWLTNEFVYDDVPEIVEWPLVHSPKNIPQFFTTADVGLYRPLKYAIVSTLWFFGGGQPGPFHVAAMLAHAVAAMLLFRIFRRLDIPPAPAAFGAFLFAVHPVHSESVYWISAISVPFSTAFLFAAFLAALAVARLAGAAAARFAIAISLLCLLAALLIREAAIVFPAFLVLYALAPIVPMASRAGRTRFVLLTLTSGVLVVAYWFWRSWVMSRQPHEFDYYTGSFAGAVLSVPYLLMRYLILFILPRGLTAYHWPGIVTSPLEPGFLMPAVTLGAMAWLAWRHRRVYPQALFFLGCFVAALIPVLNLVPINSPFAERYLYLPMFGLCGLVAWGLERVIPIAQKTQRDRSLAMAAVGLIAVLALLSLARGRVWQNDVNLFSDAVEKTPPQAIIPRYNLAKAYAESGRPLDAIDSYREVITVAPSHVPSLLNLSNLLMATGDLTTAERVLEQADTVSPGNSFVLNGLGTIWFRRGDDEQALYYFQAAAEAQPPNPLAHFNAGMACKRRGWPEEAARWFRQALELDPDYHAARLELNLLVGRPAPPLPAP